MSSFFSSSAHAPLHDQQRWIRLSLLAGFVFAVLLVLIIVLRYPGNAQTASQYLELGIGSVVVEIVICAWIIVWGTRPGSPQVAAALRQGVFVGLCCGVLWVLEISFNNIVPPDVSTGNARFYVDNGFWIIISMIILIAAAISTYHSRRIISGIRVGMWSGLVSGLIACLMGSLIVAFWINLITRGPLMIQEFAQRGPTSGATNIDTYAVYETLTGAVGHLVLLGLIMGTLLGVLGGLIGRGLNILRHALQKFS